jgi:predicted phosphodiesterase
MIIQITAQSTNTSTPLPTLATKKGPYLVLTETPSSSMKICWQFDRPETVTLEWGVDETYSLGSVSNLAVRIEDLSCVVLNGLQPGTRYYYRLGDDRAEVSGDFYTPPSDTSADLTFWGFSDSQDNIEVHDAIAAAILKEISNHSGNQTFVFDAGDIMNDPSEANLQLTEFDPRWQNIRQLAREVPMVNAMGNHDGTRLFLKYFPYPYTESFDWSFDYGPAHFAVIDLYSGVDENSPRWQWLKDDLSSTTREWKFILLHEPGWSAGPHENNEVVQKIIHPIAVHNGVDIVFSGHNHYYAHAEVDGVTYLTTGGGGGELYDPEYGWPNIINAIKAYHYLRIEISWDTLTVSILSLEGQILDQFQLINKR